MPFLTAAPSYDPSDNNGRIYGVMMDRAETVSAIFNDQFALPPGSAEAEAALLTRVRDFLPQLAGTAASTATDRRLNDEVLKEMARIGVFRAHVPAEFGGLQLPYASLAAVAMELGRACGATAWVTGVTSSGSWRLAKCKPSTQAAVWGDNPDAIIAGAFAHIGGVCEPVAGGFVVSGEWLFCSGVHHADWLGLLMPTVDEAGRPVPQFGFIPRFAVSIASTWKSVGMRATGSDNVVLDKLFVPHEMLTPYADINSRIAPGQADHDVPSYRLGLTSVFVYSVAAPLVGTAQGALDAYAVQAAKRTTASGQKLPISQIVQLRISESAAEIDGARALCERDMANTRIAAEDNRDLSDEEKLRIGRNAAFVAMACRRATTRLVESMGARGLDPQNPVQRFHADTCAGAAHGVLAWDVAGSGWANHAIANPCILA